jgi:putative protease
MTDAHNEPVSGQYLLSTRDLCAYPFLDHIAGSPVVSLKIEGRMRSPEYVAIATSVYRNALNRIQDGTWKPDPRDLFDLQMAFNRDFTPGYLLGAKPGEVMGRNLPGNRGVPAGKIVSMDPKSREAVIAMDNPLPLAKGDGLVIRSSRPDQREEGLVLTRNPPLCGDRFRIRVPEQVAPGDRVFLTKSHDLELRAEALIRTQPFRKPPLAVSMRFTIDADGIPVLEGTVQSRDNGILRETVRGTQVQPARTNPLSDDEIRSRMMKTAGGPFTVQSVETCISGQWFAPPGILNRMRRDLLALLEERVVAAYRPAAGHAEEARARLRSCFPEPDLPVQQPPKSKEERIISISVYADTAELVRAAAMAGADRIWFEPVIHTVSCPTDAPDQDPWYRLYLDTLAARLEDALGSTRGTGSALAWKLPRITRDRFLAHACRILPRLAEQGLDGGMVENFGAAFLFGNYGGSCMLSGGTGLNLFNHWSLSTLLPRFSLLSLSPELSLREIAVLTGRVKRDTVPEFEILVQGSLEVMVAEDNLIPLLAPGKYGSWQNRGGPAFGLRDSTGRIFPVTRDSECRTRIQNAVELCLIDHLPSLAGAGITSVAIDARGRGPAYARDMIRIYREAAEEVQSGTGGKNFAALKNEAKKRSRGGITAGPLLHGLAACTEESGPESLHR